MTRVLKGYTNLRIVNRLVTVDLIWVYIPVGRSRMKSQPVRIVVSLYGRRLVSIPPNSGENNTFCRNIERRQVEMKSLPDWLREELRFFFVTSWPILTVPILTQLPYLICTIIVAQSNLISQAAFSLIDTLNGPIYSAGIGMAMGIEGLFSQAFGAKNYHYLRLLLQRGLLILICSGLLLMPLNFTADKIFILLGQNATVAEEAGKMLMVLSPDNIFLFALNVFSRFLMCQDIVLPVVIVALFNNALIAVICYVTVIVLRFASLGAAVALLVYFFIGAVFMAIASSVFNKDTVAIYRINTDIFKNLWDVASMALGSAVSVMCSSIALTVGIILTGTFGVVELVTLSVSLQVIYINLNIYFGIAEACCMRVGFLLSSRDGPAAKRALFLYQGISMIVAVVIGVLICSLHVVLARGLASDSSVETKLKFMLPYVGSTLPLFAVDVIFNAAIRGCAKIAIITNTSFVTLTIGTSLGLILLYFTQLGAISVIIGYQSMSVLNALVFVPYALFVLDWDEQSGLARQRTADDLKLIRDGIENGELDYSTFELTKSATLRQDST
ncbi:multidrug and toxin extrusion protein 2-like [Tubulanus polymorphus]|uniref:multidrug and toxin extrusion protein 2-like n=1 Tax=Tubulanus polymorphus TaxID=672921 RepID=UPI003DA58363